MEFSSKFIENAVNEISNLPGIGKKSALRLVLFLLKQPESQSQNLANAISQMRLNVNFCKNAIIFLTLIFVKYVQILEETNLLFVLLKTLGM